jgi:hypothetical protein
MKALICGTARPRMEKTRVMMKDPAMTGAAMSTPTAKHAAVLVIRLSSNAAPQAGPRRRQAVVGVAETEQHPMMQVQGHQHGDREVEQDQPGAMGAFPAASD